MELKEIALEAAVDYLKFKLGDRKGFNVYDIDAYDADELIAEIEQECAKSFMDFLDAVDAERGKNAVAWVDGFGDMHLRNSTFPNAGWKPLFLSPTIPEGECGCKLVPDYDAIRDAERYRFLRDEENWVDDDPDFAIRPWETLGESSGKEFDSTIDSYMKHRKAMIQAAGVTK